MLGLGLYLRVTTSPSPGTAARFSGQSIGRYRLPRTQAWSARFRLRTQQSEATILLQNREPVGVSLQVSFATPCPATLYSVPPEVLAQGPLGQLL